MRPVSDKSLISAVFKHCEVWPFIGDDTVSADWEPAIVDGVYYLMPESNDAVFMVHPHSSLLWECHSAVLPEARRNSLIYAKQALEWVKANLPCKCMTTLIPEGNFRATALARRMGFKKIGLLPTSWKTGDTYTGQMMLAMEI